MIINYAPVIITYGGKFSLFGSTALSRNVRGFWYSRFNARKPHPPINCMWKYSAWEFIQFLIFALLLCPRKTRNFAPHENVPLYGNWYFILGRSPDILSHANLVIAPSAIKWRQSGDVLHGNYISFVNRYYANSVVGPPTYTLNTNHHSPSLMSTIKSTSTALHKYTCTLAGQVLCNHSLNPHWCPP